MASTSLDQLSSRLFDLESKPAGFISSPSLASLSSSGSDSNGFDCPSLTTSSTLSFEDFTELETDLDVDDTSPVDSPFVGSAYDLTCELATSVDVLQSDDGADPATPRPLRVERKGYFPQVGKLDDKGYESEGETSSVVAKRRLGMLKGRKVEATVRVGQLGHKRANSTSRALRNPYIDGVVVCTPANSPVQVSHPTSSEDAQENIEETSHTDNSVEATSSKAKKHYAGLGLGLPSTWNGELTPRTHTDASKEVLSSSIKASGESSLGHDQLEPVKGPKEIVLKPFDSVLEFLQTPSPMESLPSPLLSTEHKDYFGLNSQMLGGMDSRVDLFGESDSSAHVGSGLTVAFERGSTGRRSADPFDSSWDDTSATLH